MEVRTGTNAGRKYAGDDAAGAGYLSARQIAECQLNKYFEMIEARLPPALARGRTVITAHEHGRSAAERGRRSSRIV
jgi:hypothetical protein